jgi:hypothetical protein
MSENREPKGRRHYRKKGARQVKIVSRVMRKELD